MIITLFPILFFSLSVNGQEYKENQTVQIIVHKIIIPEGGSLKEALLLTKEWTENILRKNENFEDIQLLLSDTKKDTIDLLVQYRFKLDNTRDTNEIIQELINDHWPEEGAFQKFITQLQRYIDPKLNERSSYKQLILE